MAEDRSLMEMAFIVQQNPNANPFLAGALSLVVPGLGQIYLGQYFKGVAMFFGSIALCFGFGLANLSCALDAYSLAKTNQERSIGRNELSWWLFWAKFIWRLIKIVRN